MSGNSKQRRKSRREKMRAEPMLIKYAVEMSGNPTLKREFHPATIYQKELDAALRGTYEKSCNTVTPSEPVPWYRRILSRIFAFLSS